MRCLCKRRQLPLRQHYDKLRQLSAPTQILLRCRRVTALLRIPCSVFAADISKRRFMARTYCMLRTRNVTWCSRRANRVMWRYHRVLRWCRKLLRTPQRYAFRERRGISTRTQHWCDRSLKKNRAQFVYKQISEILIL